MAKSSQAVILFAVALSLALFGIGHCTDPRFYVEGRVYCDTCRIQFVTKVSSYIPGIHSHFHFNNAFVNHRKF